MLFPVDLALSRRFPTLLRGFLYRDPDAALIGDNCRVRSLKNDLRGRLLVLLPEQA